MSTGQTPLLLDRVRRANDRIDQLTSGVDTREQFTRARGRASDLLRALATWERTHNAAEQLREAAALEVAQPGLAPPPADVSPLQWFDSGSGIAYVEKVAEDAEAFASRVHDAWAEFLDGLAPSLLDPALLERMRGGSESLDRACDRLSKEMKKWHELPTKVPGEGDVSRAKEIADGIAEAWQSLADSGATPERIEFLERVGRGRVPFTLVDDELAAWLRDTGLAAQLFVTTSQ